MASIAAAAPQFLVEKLNDSLTFYEQRLGFSRDFVYEDFYASVSRDRAVIHLKCAPKLAAERAHRRSGEHLDAYLVVSGVGELHRSSSVVERVSQNRSSRGAGARTISTSRIRMAISCASRKPSNFRLGCPR